MDYQCCRFRLKNPGGFGIICNFEKRKLLNRYLLILLIFLLFTCKKDNIVPCQCNENSNGLLCRVYEYVEEECVGYINFEYNDNDALSKQYYFSVIGNLKKYSVFNYSSNGYITDQTDFDNKHEIINRYVYGYNSFDSIESISLYKNLILEEKCNYVYNTSYLLTGIFSFHQNQLFSYELYQYDAENIIWKLSEYSQDSVLQSYTIFQHFNNGVIREDYYNGSFEFTGYKTRLYTSDNLISIINIYNKDGITSSRDVFEYNNKSLTKYSKFNSEGERILQTIYQYY